MVGRQTPILALFVPLALVAIVDGRRGMRETWPVAVVCGVVFAIAQYATSNFLSVPLADVVASLVSAAAVVVGHGAAVARRPARACHAERRRSSAGGGGRRSRPPDCRPTPRLSATRRDCDDSARTWSGRTRRTGSSSRSSSICQIPAVKSLLDKATIAFDWPGLDVVDADGDPLSLTKFTLNLLTTPGTQMLVAGVLTMSR